MRHIHRSEQWLPYPVDLVFSFFANPENLPRLMPSWQKARIEEAVFAPPPPAPTVTVPHVPIPQPRLRSIAAGAGTRMTIIFRPFPYSPLRVPWEAEISEFVWNDHFCDVQLRGPFAYWRHCHHLHSEARTDASGQLLQGTLLIDEVEYELPFGQFGDLAQRLILGRQLKSLFAYRHTRTSQLLSFLVRTSNKE